MQFYLTKKENEIYESMILVSKQVVEELEESSRRQLNGPPKIIKDMLESGDF